MATNYYGALGVASDASDDEIKKAYRKLVRELHPDVNPDPAAHDRFKEVSTAYEVLSDPEKRRIVDLGGDPLGSGGGGGGQNFSQGFGFGDIMDAFFGGGGGQQRGPRSRARAGADALLRLDLDLAETAFGAEKSVTVDTATLCETCDGRGAAPGTSLATCPQCEGRGEIQTVSRTLLGQMMTTRACPRCQGTGQVIPQPCATCSGDGRVRNRRDITVKVPAGVRDGMRIHLSGYGEVGPGGGPAGDLYIEVHERDHAVFHREGDDLHCELTLPMTAAALGTSVTLTTLDGDEEIDVRAGTQNGHVVTLHNRGAQHLQSHGRGDLHAHVAVETPTRLDDEQEALLRQLATLRGEERPDGQKAAAGVFGKLRGAFTGR